MKKLPGIHGIDIPNLRVKIAQWFFNKNWESGNTATSCIGKILVNCYSQSDISLCYKWLTGKESAWQCRRHMRCVFNPWVAKILWRRKWQITPVFFPGKSHEQRPGRLQYVGLQRVERDRVHTLCLEHRSINDSSPCSLHQRLRNQMFPESCLPGQG